MKHRCESTAWSATSKFTPLRARSSHRSTIYFPFLPNIRLSRYAIVMFLFYCLLFRVIISTKDKNLFAKLSVRRAAENIEKNYDNNFIIEYSTPKRKIALSTSFACEEREELSFAHRVYFSLPYTPNTVAVFDTLYFGTWYILDVFFYNFPMMYATCIMLYPSFCFCLLV